MFLIRLNKREPDDLSKNPSCFVGGRRVGGRVGWEEEDKTHAIVHS